MKILYINMFIYKKRAKFDFHPKLSSTKNKCHAWGVSYLCFGPKSPSKQLHFQPNHFGLAYFWNT